MTTIPVQIPSFLTQAAPQTALHPIAKVIQDRFGLG